MLNETNHRDQNNLNKSIRKFFQNEKQNWPLLRQNYESLNKISVRKMEFDGFSLLIQHNPERIVSSSADTSKIAINNRKCFLCKENRPIEQKHLGYKHDFIILANPYPIFEEHFTIVSAHHIEQSIEPYIGTMLDLAKDYGDSYSILYNGPRCGASAPDHMHFQAVTKNVLPLQYEFYSITNQFGLQIIRRESIVVSAIKNILRNCICIESSDQEEINRTIVLLLNTLKRISNSEEEPMINIIADYENGNWRIFLFPRKAHRPRQYYLDEEKRILLSPAIVDLCGLLITPRKEDFEKLTREDAVDIFKQVCIDDEEIDHLSRQLEG